MKFCESCKSQLVYVQGAQTLYFGQGGNRIDVKHKDNDILLCESCRRVYSDPDSLKSWKDALSEQRIRDIKKIMEKKK